MKKLVAALVASALLLCANIVFAAAPNISGVVRIKCADRYGSGVYLGDRLVLTCSHLFNGAETEIAYAVFPNGEKYFGRLAKQDTTWDQAVLQLYEDVQETDVKPALIASANPEPGDVVYSAGYDAGNSVIVREGKVTNLIANGGPDPQLDWFAMSDAVKNGSSGGPVFNANGEVIGPLWGSNDSFNETVASMCGRTQRFLLPWNARLAAVRSAQCGPAGCPPQVSSRQVPVQRPAQTPVQAPQQLYPVQRPEPQKPAVDSTALDKINEQIEALNAKLGELTGRVDGHDASIAGLSAAQEELAGQLADQAAKNADQDAQLTAVQTGQEEINQRMGDLISLVQANSEQIAQIGDTINTRETNLTATIDSKFQELAEQKDKETEQEVKKAVDEFAGQVWIYYTSRACSECKEIDDRIQALRAKGYPIVVTYLSPQQASVTGIPKIFIPSSNKEVTGISNCRTYLAGLVPR